MRSSWPAALVAAAVLLVVSGCGTSTQTPAESGAGSASARPAASPSPSLHTLLVAASDGPGSVVSLGTLQAPAGWGIVGGPTDSGDLFVGYGSSPSGQDGLSIDIGGRGATSQASCAPSFFDETTPTTPVTIDGYHGVEAISSSPPEYGEHAIIEVDAWVYAGSGGCFELDGTTGAYGQATAANQALLQRVITSWVPPTGAAS